MDPQPAPPLPLLREDLIISPAGPNWQGAAMWLIEDRIRNRFYRIGKSAVDLLAHWRPIDPQIFAGETASRLGRDVQVEEVEELRNFLQGNSLVEHLPVDDQKKLAKTASLENWFSPKALLKNYLFFRIPIARPQRFLDAVWPFIAALYTRAFVVIWSVLALFSLLLVQRHWEEFLGTFSSFLTPKGFALYALSLVFIKSVHELGHAFMARKYRVEVPVIGAAFILMMPILYTDTTAAWRLKSNRERLLIDLGGIFAELALAVFATLVWIFLPDGNLRAIAFTTATLSWIMSLTVNLNPFMRFDGYYILCDALGLENLQNRGFALARWKLREWLFALNVPPPENFEPRTMSLVIAHAFGTWIYRFFLFLGIALLVYHFAFKALGIILFVVEMAWFIALPIAREILNWWGMKNSMSINRVTLRNLIIAGGLIFAALWPLDQRIHFGAVHGASVTSPVFAPFAAQLRKLNVENGQEVTKGQLLAQLGSSELEHEQRALGVERAILAARLARIHADERDRSIIQVLRSQLAQLEERQQSLNTRVSALFLRAPHDGVVVDLDRNLHSGQWVGTELKLAVIANLEEIGIRGLVDENQRRRLEDRATGIFVPQDPSLPKMNLRLVSAGSVSGADDTLKYLQDVAGGPIPVRPGTDGSMEPIGSWYPILLEGDGAEQRSESANLIIRGTVILDAKPQSFAGQISKRVVAVLVRESGF